LAEHRRRVAPASRGRIYAIWRQGAVCFGGTRRDSDVMTEPRLRPRSYPSDIRPALRFSLLHSEYDKAKEEIRYIAAQRGHLNYRMISHRVLIDLERYEAIIELHLETGDSQGGDIFFKIEN
jgi:hypothetical protein